MNQKNLLLCFACLALFILSPPSLAKTAACHQSWMGSRKIQHAGFEQIFGPKSQDFFQNNNLFFQTQGYQMWPLTQNVPYERMQGMRTYGKRMDEKWIAKPFAMERLNGWTDDENVWMDEVERINGWRKFLNGCSRTDERLKKNFERLAVMCWVFLVSMSWSKFTAWGTYSMHFCDHARHSRDREKTITQ